MDAVSIAEPEEDELPLELVVPVDGAAAFCATALPAVIELTPIL